MLTALLTLMILIPPLNRRQTANKVPDTTDKMPDSSNEVPDIEEKMPDNEQYVSENGSITTAETVELLDVKYYQNRSNSKGLLLIYVRCCFQDGEENPQLYPKTALFIYF